MSLKCSVLGHRFGDTDVTREREEQGSEVVITITETETCDRCGETRVVSENKEVTTLETPSDIVGDDLGSDESDATGDPEDDSDVAEVDADSGETAPAEPPGEPARTDDAELIEEVEEADQQGDRAEDEPREEVTATAADSVGGESRHGDDAVIIDEGDDDEDEERAPGEWPQETADEDSDDWVPETSPGELRPVEEEQPDIESTGEATTVPEGQFHCPECDFTTDVESSSLREGDFCPKCHRGALSHHSEES